MNKTELVRALLDAGLRPEDLTEEYARATAVNEELKSARSELVAAILNYIEAIYPGVEFKADDAKHLEKYFENVEQKRDRHSPFAMFLDEMK